MKVDPVFAEAVGMLFGDAVDPREAWDSVSKMDDTSEVHIPGNNKIAKKPAPKLKKADATAIAKAFEADVAEIVAERMAGRITTEQALELIEVVEKGMRLNNAMLMGGAAKTALKAQPIVAGRAVKAGIKNAKQARVVRQQNKAMATYAPNMAKTREPEAIRTLVGAAALGAGGLGYGAGHSRGLRQGSAMGAATSFGKSVDTTWSGEISKVDGDKRQVFGWCSLSEVDGEPVVDLQGDYVPIDAIESSAYKYVLTSRKGGDMHERDGEVPLHTSDLIESFVVTPDKLEKMGLPGDSLPLGWWVGFKVNDDKQWDMVKKNERTGFSIHGKGSRVEKVLG